MTKFFFSIAEHADEYEKERICLILKLRVLQVKEHGKQCIFTNTALKKAENNISERSPFEYSLADCLL